MKGNNFEYQRYKMEQILLKIREEKSEFEKLKLQMITLENRLSKQYENIKDIEEANQNALNLITEKFDSLAEISNENMNTHMKKVTIFLKDSYIKYNYLIGILHSILLQKKVYTKEEFIEFDNSIDQKLIDISFLDYKDLRKNSRKLRIHFDSVFNKDTQGQQIGRTKP